MPLGDQLLDQLALPLPLSLLLGDQQDQLPLLPSSLLLSQLSKRGPVKQGKQQELGILVQLNLVLKLL